MELQRERRRPPRARSTSAAGGHMKDLSRSCAIVFLLLFVAPWAWSGDTIPKAAWKRPMGLPLAGAGTRKAALTSDPIDDGYWQGAPVGGFGAGTFSRTYRGDFARWHLKTGAHKYETVDVNQFAMFQQAEGSPAVVRVLSASHPAGRSLSSWQWDYPVGAGDYYALYPKSWYDYRWNQFPAHVVLEQFSPILPNNYRDSSYPVAVYRWQAENSTDHAVTVSVMLSWANMLGWFNSFSRDLDSRRNHGNRNRFATEPQGATGTMKGLVFDRNHFGPVENEWDGQFAIA